MTGRRGRLVSGRSRLASGAVLLALVAALVVPPAGARAQSLEYALKAAYLYKFPVFIDWPDGALGPEDRPVTVCVVGEDPFGPELDKALQGQTIKKHAITVQRHATISSNPGCHIVYAAGSAAQSPAEILAATHGTGVLTVTELEDASSESGVINFVIRSNRVKFEIDQGAARRNGLSISSRLLELALKVR